MKTIKVMKLAALAAMAVGAATAAEVGNLFQIANVSMRARVGTGQEVLIMGLVVRSETEVLIRGIGPSLEQFGVSDCLEDPMLEVFNSNGEKVGEALGLDTLGFIEHERVVGLGAKLGAFPITGVTKDAGLVITLAPGIYTVHVKSIAGGSGMALAEAYFEEPPST